MDTTRSEPERPDPPAGTLATAMAVIDQAIEEQAAQEAVGGVGDDVYTRWERIVAAWPTARAAALQSLEPAPAAKRQVSYVAEARMLEKAATERITELVQDPCRESAAAIDMITAASTPGMLRCLVDGLGAIADAVRSNTMTLEEVRRELSLGRTGP